MNRRIAVLVSGSGSNLQALLDAEDLGGDVVAVLSDRPGVLALERAARAGVPSAVVAPADHADRELWGKALAEAIAAFEPDLLVLAGFMRILPAAIVQRWPTINVHPSLLPAFPGAHAVDEALAWGVKLTGCTVHYVDEQVDHGPIIFQAAVAVEEGDDRDRLHARIREHEHRLLPAAVRLHCSDRLQVVGRTVRILP